jgi:hypothetical protein
MTSDMKRREVITLLATQESITLPGREVLGTVLGLTAPP